MKFKIPTTCLAFSLLLGVVCFDRAALGAGKATRVASLPNPTPSSKPSGTNSASAGGWQFLTNNFYLESREKRPVDPFFSWSSNQFVVLRQLTESNTQSIKVLAVDYDRRVSLEETDKFVYAGEIASVIRAITSLGDVQMQVLSNLAEISASEAALKTRINQTSINDGGHERAILEMEGQLVDLGRKLDVLGQKFGDLEDHENDLEARTMLFILLIGAVIGVIFFIIPALARYLIRLLNRASVDDKINGGASRSPPRSDFSGVAHNDGNSVPRVATTNKLAMPTEQGIAVSPGHLTGVPNQSGHLVPNRPPPVRASRELPNIWLAEGLLPKIISYLERRLGETDLSFEEGGALVGWRCDVHGKRGYEIVGFIDSGPRADRSAGHLNVDNDYITKQLSLWSRGYPQLEIVGFIHRHPGAMDYCSGGDLRGDIPVVRASERKEMIFGIITINHPNQNDNAAFYVDRGVVRDRGGGRFKVNFFYLGESSDYQYEGLLPRLRSLQVVDNLDPRIRSLARFGPSAEHQLDYFLEVVHRDFPGGKAVIRPKLGRDGEDIHIVTVSSRDMSEKIHLIEQPVGQFRILINLNDDVFEVNARRPRDHMHALQLGLDSIEQARSQKKKN